MAEVFERFVGQRVKIVFKDGDQIKAKYGTLISAADGFATIETVYGTCAVKIAEIVKVQTAPAAGDGHG